MTTALSENGVWLVRQEGAGYGPSAEPCPPELSGDVRVTEPLLLVRRLFRDAGLDASRYGRPEWNPLGDLIAPGAKVLLKPNWVLEVNRLAGGGTECLVTHASVIEAVLHYVVRTAPREVVIGDAPIQECDLAVLHRECGVDEMIERFRDSGVEIRTRDFRLTKRPDLYRDKVQERPDPERYQLFDLGRRSWLDPIATPEAEFRVSNYDHRILAEHHDSEKHQYLIARDVVDADVVISLPKLKTHKKSGVTGALKNMVGINGFKEYLPHHRKGGSGGRGDCYPGTDWLKSVAEDSLDRANQGTGPVSRYLNSRVASLALHLDAALQRDADVEGSWYGNDTVWRMCLDLQRILHYGTNDGRVAPTVQRKVLTITDAVIGGDGDGPLAPNPVEFGVITFGQNVAALEWVHCLLMGLDPSRIPLTTHAFDRSDWPLANFSPEDIRVVANGEALAGLEGLRRFRRRFTPPAGWQGHCEVSAPDRAAAAV